jgi:diaminopimelate epimerase
MGVPTFVSSEIPVRGPRREVIGEQLRVDHRVLNVTCVSVGNPHCVVFVPELDVDELRRLGPLIERHSNFPNRTNVQFARVASRRSIDILIWERGAGETQASGSSSSAVAAAAYRLGLVGPVVTRMPGGSLAIEIMATATFTSSATRSRCTAAACCIEYVPIDRALDEVGGRERLSACLLL